MTRVINSPTRPTGPAFSEAASDTSLRHLSSGEMHDILLTTKREIKAIRGWHGSRLAVAGGVAGGAAAVGAVGVGIVATGGIGLVVAGIAGAGVAAAGGGAAAGYYKTYRGRSQCKQNALLMGKIELLTHMRTGMKARKQELSGDERLLYRNIKHVIDKVDGSSLKEVGMNVAKTTGAAAGVVVATAVVAAAVLVVAGAAGGGGGDFGCCCGASGGGGFGCGGGGGFLLPPEDPREFAGISVTEANLTRLRAAAVELAEPKKRA